MGENVFLINQSMNQLKYRFKAMTKASVFVLRSPKFMQSLMTTYSQEKTS